MSNAKNGTGRMNGKQRLIVYDLDEKNELLLSEWKETDQLLSADPMVKDCLGCFNCWIRTPGSCMIKDRCSVLPGYLANADEVVIISPVVYGSYSPRIKGVLDRSIGYLLPFFRIIGNEMHHQMRYQNPFKFRVLFYGECDSLEKETARKLVEANGINLGAGSVEVRFLETPELIREELS